jgi:hypothetical protein
MYRALIAVVDAARARLFAFERSAGPTGPCDGLYERVELVPSGRAESTFPRNIAEQVGQLARELSPRRVIVCANPHMLGELRIHLARQPIVIDELADDLVKLPAPQLRNALAERGLLPARPVRSASRVTPASNAR